MPPGWSSTASPAGQVRSHRARLASLRRQPGTADLPRNPGLSSAGPVNPGIASARAKHGQEARMRVPPLLCRTHSPTRRLRSYPEATTAVRGRLLV